MDDVVTMPDWAAVVDRGPPPPDAKYTPFVLDVGEPVSGVPVANGLTLHSDGSITVDWRRLEIYARYTPVDRAHAEGRDFSLGCMVRALLALRDGRVNVVENGDG